MIYKCPKPIAILLAVYNGEKYLQVQIDSILAQTNQQWVLYIRDDDSTDSTQQIIFDYCLKYDNIVAVKDKLGNLGCYENFRQLLRVVKSKYYMFSDADDYWLPEKVQISYDFILKKEEQYPNIPILAHCDKIITDSNLDIINDSGWASLKFNPDIISKFDHIPLHIAGGASSIFNSNIREKYCDEKSPFPTAHDGWIALQTTRYGGKIFAIHKPLMMYRLHENSTTSTDKTIQTFAGYIKKMVHINSTLKYHWKFASLMQTIGYGSKLKYFYYRVVVFLKLMWGRFIYDK